MSDCYEWLDPFAEHQRAVRAEQRAAYAHEDGRRSVLSMIAERKEGDFRKALDHALGYLVEDITQGTLRPYIAENFDAFQAAKSRADARASLMVEMMRPVLAFVHQNGELRLDTRMSGSRDEEMLTVSYEPKPPKLNSHHVNMSPSMWR